MLKNSCLLQYNQNNDLKEDNGSVEHQCDNSLWVRHYERPFSHHLIFSYSINSQKNTENSLVIHGAFW